MVDRSEEDLHNQFITEGIIPTSCGRKSGGSSPC